MAQKTHCCPPHPVLRLCFCCVVAGALFAMGSILFLGFLSPENTFSSIPPQETTPKDAADTPPPASAPAVMAEPTPTASEESSFLQVPDATLQEPEITRIVAEVRSGDTPATFLADHLRVADIYALCAESARVYPLDRLRAGQPWIMLFHGERLIGFEYEIDAHEKLIVSLEKEKPEIRKESIPYEIRQATISATIDGSLWNTIVNLGENPELVLMVAKLFAWDIDFHRDIQSGDSFQVIVDKRFRDGTFVGYGDIHAARFTNAGVSYYAFRYTTTRGETGYYDAQGRSLRKDFLRAPLPFLKVSSGYSMSRKHPILGYRRPHQGIDYSAPTGTPIFAVADGTIIERSHNGSQGNYIVLRHAGGLETTYNHMSRFNPLYHNGSKVRQGAIIGYVGSTGLATGPHLDFRMRMGKTFINPEEYYKKHKTTPATVLSAHEMAHFRAHIMAWQNLLNQDSKVAQP